MDNRLLDLPPLDAIRGFVAVARRMSITHAAGDLCLTQSAVSRQIQALEEYFGAPLLVRKHRAISLTEAGERLFHLASPWLDRIADYGDTMRRQSRMRPVTITASIGVTSLWILPRLGAFQEQHPNIDVRVSANNRVLDLRREDIDLAIRYARTRDAPADSLKLFEEAVVPVARPDIASRMHDGPKALLKEALLELDERALPWMRWSSWFAAAGMHDAKPRSYLSFNQYDQVAQAAIEGHGIALGRLALVLPMLLDGRLAILPGQEIARSDYAYWLVDATREPRDEVRIFREWIIEEVRVAVRKLAGINVGAVGQEHNAEAAIERRRQPKRPRPVKG
jgi:LysR family transcriptional regulator, glycine cleavage system transcriptional activator